MKIKFVMLKALRKVIDDKKPYNLVLDQTDKEFNLSNDDLLRIKVSLFGVLRHFWSLKWEIVNQFNDLKDDDDELYLLICALYEIRFSQKISPLYQIIEETTDTIVFEELKLDINETKEKLEFLAKITPIFNVYATALENIALKSSIPQWMAKMWLKQFGEEETLKIIESCTKKQIKEVAINTMKCKRDDILADKIYQPCLTNLNTCYFVGLGRLSDYREIREGKIYPQSESVQSFINDLPLKIGTKLLHIGAETGGIASSIAIKEKLRIEEIAVFSSSKRCVRGKAMFSRLGLDNIKTVNTTLKILPSYYGQVFDTVIVTPPNSGLGQIKKRPDILVNFLESDIDERLKIENYYLREGASYLKKGGILAYMVQTLNTKETSKLIEDFVAKSTEYQIVLQKQIFPYESDGIYYAILRKENA